MVKLDEFAERLSIVERDGKWRVTARESKDLEFKREFTIATLKKSLKTIAAFANAGGGEVVFGIADKPRELFGIIGQNIDEGHVSELLTQALLPIPEWDLCEFELKAKKLCVLSVSPAIKPPIIAIKDFSIGDKPALQQGVIYTRRRGQTSPITGAEFNQLMNQRDEALERRIFQFLSKGRDIGFDRAIVAGRRNDGDTNDAMSFYLPATSAKELNVVDTARLVESDGAPAYELIGSVQLFAPSDEDPRVPLKASDSATQMAECIRRIFYSEFPWSFSHLKKVSAHLGFWKSEEGDGVHTGKEKLTGTTVYYQAGRDAILDFARQNPDEFVDVVASQRTRDIWRNRMPAEAQADELN